LRNLNGWFVWDNFSRVFNGLFGVPKLNAFNLSSGFNGDKCIFLVGNGKYTPNRLFFGGMNRTAMRWAMRSEERPLRKKF